MKILAYFCLLLLTVFALLYSVESAAYTNHCGRYGHDHNSCSRYCKLRPCPRNGLYQGVRAESGRCTYGSCVCVFPNPTASRTRSC